MQTHLWNNRNAQDVRSLEAAGYGECGGDRTLVIAVSLAEQDGVYDLDDLRRALDISELPMFVRRPLQEYADGECGRDLNDIRTLLRDLPRMDLDDTDEGEDEDDTPVLPDLHDMLPHHAAHLAAQRRRALKVGA